MSNSLFSLHTRLSEEVFARFMSLPQGEEYQAEYICKYLCVYVCVPLYICRVLLSGGEER